MAYKIDPTKCIACGTCQSVCPQNPPAPEKDEETGKFKIVPERCKECGTCAENCPVEAISKG